jgi:hypothetical protein
VKGRFHLRRERRLHALSKGGMPTAEIESAMNFRIDISSYELLTNPGHGLSRGKSTKLPNSARSFYIALIATGLACTALCQEIPQIEPTQAYHHAQLESSGASEHESRHILGVIPNYKTSPNFDHYEPLTSREKFKIASEDSLDPGTFALSAVFGGLGQVTDANKSFGQGVAGFGRYFGASYGDLLIGNYMSEAVYPSILHQDPRYFRRGTGSGSSRFAYAISQVFWTHRDSGGTQFNYSEWFGNSTAVAISNAYYPDHRGAGSSMSKLGMQIGLDAVGNVLKEFWPDLQRKFCKQSSNKLTAGGTK